MPAKRKYAAKRRGSVGRASKRLNATFKNKVKKVIQYTAEKKVTTPATSAGSSVAFNSGAPATWSAATWTEVNNGLLWRIVNGNAQGQRIGNKIHVTKIHFKLQITPNAGVFANGGIFRIIMIYDKGNAGGTSAYADFTDNAIASGTAGAENNPKTVNNRRRFKFLIDKVICFSPNVVVPYCFDWWIPINTTFSYGNNNGNIGDMDSGNITWGYISSEAAVANVRLGYQQTVFYTDV